MNLGELLGGAGLPVPVAGAAVTVNHVVEDSREARPGTVFVGLSGLHVDGAEYAAEAVDRGAVAVVAGHPPRTGLPDGTPFIRVEDAPAALSRLAAVLAGHPSRQLVVAGVTGTDGKTTTATMLHAAWRSAGLAAASLTTVDNRVGDEVLPNKSRLTTAGASQLQERLRALVDRGMTHVALETSSHALAQRRVEDVDFRIAVYTRITSEHVDFHGTHEAYVAAKAHLAEMVGRRDGGVVVLDADDRVGLPVLSAVPAPRRLLYSATGRSAADIVAEDVRVDSGEIRFIARTPWGAERIELKIAGRFNVANALAAVAGACVSGAPLDRAAAGLGALQRVTGRMERVALGQPFTVIVDYAHTAEALETVLGELRATTPGRLWAVFGSAGERDRLKRPAMGRVAAELADVVILTDEDPREEDRLAILEEIAAGARVAGASDGETLHLVPDRRQAIFLALGEAGAGDTVLCAGKGHEDCIIAGRERLPWDERAIVEAALRTRLERDETALATRPQRR
jgi:UDP-N-acetylmuramoyl-L-alanyl-D-glutamate--2,6-diaminopimelate ligase